jgi:hypothetical protein
VSKAGPIGSYLKQFIGALAGILAVVAVVGYLVVWVGGLPGPYRGVYSAHGSLHNIYEGLRGVDEAIGHLPPAAATDAKSNRRTSWRVEVYQSTVRDGFITPPEGGASTSINYDRRRAWNDAANLRLETLGAWLFYYTQTRGAPELGKYGYHTTYYKAITGPGTAFDSATPPSLKKLPGGLILVVRVEHSDTHWMEPGDLNVEQLTPSDDTKRLLLSKDGYIVLFADGDGWVLSPKTPLSDLCKFFTVAGARRFDRETLLGPYRVLP